MRRRYRQRPGVKLFLFSASGGFGVAACPISCAALRCAHRSVMAQEFAERFGSPDAPAYLDFVIQRLRPGHIWEKLDIKIAAFAQNLYHVNDMEGALDFWDKMRYLLQALPKRPPQKEWDENLGASLKLQKSKERWRYAVCDLCWRIVPLNTDSKKRVKPLCFEHDLPPGSPTYRKHERLKAQVLATAHGLEKELRAIYPSSFAGADDRKKFRALNCEHLTGEVSPLKNLVAYIREKLNTYDLTDLDWDARCTLVLEIFHGPFEDNLEPLYKEAMDEYIYNRVYFEPLADIRQLALAEAWLAALKTDRRRKDQRTETT